MSQAVIEGEVRGFRQWAETVSHPITNEDIQEQVWTFQLERHREGRPLPPVPVEIRGQSISGVLNEGHVVRLDQSMWQEGQTVRTTRVYNVTLNTPVMAVGKNMMPQIIVSIIVVLIVVGFVVGFYLFMNR